MLQWLVCEGEATSTSKPAYSNNRIHPRPNTTFFSYLPCVESLLLSLTNGSHNFFPSCHCSSHSARRSLSRFPIPSHTSSCTYAIEKCSDTSKSLSPQCRKSCSALSQGTFLRTQLITTLAPRFFTIASLLKGQFNRGQWEGMSMMMINTGRRRLTSASHSPATPTQTLMLSFVAPYRNCSFPVHLHEPLILQTV